MHFTPDRKLLHESTTTAHCDFVPRKKKLSWGNANYELAFLWVFSHHRSHDYNFFILFLSLLVLVLLVLLLFFLLKHSFLSIANRHWSSIPIVANSVYASVGKCIVTNGVKSSFDQGTLFWKVLDKCSKPDLHEYIDMLRLNQK